MVKKKGADEHVESKPCIFYSIQVEANLFLRIFFCMVYKIKIKRSSESTYFVIFF